MKGEVKQQSVKENDFFLTLDITSEEGGFCYHAIRNELMMFDSGLVYGAQFGRATRNDSISLRES